MRGSVPHLSDACFPVTPGDYKRFGAVGFTKEPPCPDPRPGTT